MVVLVHERVRSQEREVVGEREVVAGLPLQVPVLERDARVHMSARTQHVACVNKRRRALFEGERDKLHNIYAKTKQNAVGSSVARHGRERAHITNKHDCSKGREKCSGAQSTPVLTPQTYMKYKRK